MSASLVTAGAIAKAASPIIKELYIGAKGGVQKALSKWNSRSFPAKLLKSLSDLDTVRTIWSPDKSVSLSEFYYPGKIISDDRTPAPVESISDLGCGCTVVQGIIGQGKSVLLRHLAIQEIFRGDGARLPLFFELRKLSKSNTLFDGLRQSLLNYDIKIDEEVFSYLASSGKLVLLLDGFDELDSEIVKNTTLEIEGLVTRFPRLQIIVSSRPNNEIQKLSIFEVTKVAPLEPLDYQPFLRKLGVKIDRSIEIVSAIEASPSKVSELINTPLMLTLVVLVYQSENQIPSELPEFFDKLFYTVFTKHDKLKPAFYRQHYSGLSEGKLKRLFEAFCFMSIQFGNGRTLTPSEFYDSFAYAVEYTENTSCSEDGFKKDITKVSCLMLEEGFDQTTFLHKSIAEYHAAAFIRSSDDAFAERFYQEAGPSWQQWQECLKFLKSIDGPRFSKYYALERIPAAIELLKPLLDCKTGLEVYASLPDWLKTLRVRYRKIDAERYFLCAFGNWSVPDNWYCSQVGDSLSNSLFVAIPSTLTNQTVQELRDEEFMISQEVEDELEIGIVQIIDFWGYKEIRAEIAGCLKELTEQLEAAERSSQQMARKPFIFDRKKSTAPS